MRTAVEQTSGNAAISTSAAPAGTRAQTAASTSRYSARLPRFALGKAADHAEDAVADTERMRRIAAAHRVRAVVRAHGVHDAAKVEPEDSGPGEAQQHCLLALRRLPVGRVERRSVHLDAELRRARGRRQRHGGDLDGREVGRVPGVVARRA